MNTVSLVTFISRTLLLGVGLTVVLAPAAFSPLVGQPLRLSGDGPMWLAGTEILGRDGPVWVAASEVLNKDGSFRNTWGLNKEIREQVRRQSAAFAVAHPYGVGAEMEDGARPPRAFCAGVAPLVPDGPKIRVTPLYDARLEDVDLIVLTASVAVVATVSRMIPGFLSNGDPGLLLELEELLPLHSGAFVPSYALIPADQVMISGRAFCADELRVEYPFRRPEVGDRVALVGSLRRDESVVWPWTLYSGLFGVERATNGSDLDWATGWELEIARGVGGKLPVAHVSVRSLVDLYRYVEALEASGLFTWVQYLLSDPAIESEARDQFFDVWRSAREAGCRPRSAEEDESGAWRLTGLTCDLPVLEAKSDAAIADDFLRVRSAGAVGRVQEQ